jgi:hypothetical protein
MSIKTIRKIGKNLKFIISVKPRQTSACRATAEAITENDATREITNFQTALNLVLKLNSKRLEITANQFHAYV